MDDLAGIRIVRCARPYSTGRAPIRLGDDGGWTAAVPDARDDRDGSRQTRIERARRARSTPGAGPHRLRRTDGPYGWTSFVAGWREFRETARSSPSQTSRRAATQKVAGRSIGPAGHRGGSVDVHGGPAASGGWDSLDPGPTLRVRTGDAPRGFPRMVDGGTEQCT